MKNLITLLVFLCVTPYTLQALENQTGKLPVIDELRSSFSQSEVPTLDDLNLGEKIFCKGYSTSSGERIVTEAHFKFSQNEQEAYFNSIQGTTSATILNSGKNTLVGSFTLTKSKMSGIYRHFESIFWSSPGKMGGYTKQTIYHLDIRKNKNGVFLVEFATDDPEVQKLGWFSLVKKDYFAASYWTCDPNEDFGEGLIL